MTELPRLWRAAKAVGLEGPRRVAFPERVGEAARGPSDPPPRAARDTVWGFYAEPAPHDPDRKYSAWTAESDTKGYWLVQHRALVFRLNKPDRLAGIAYTYRLWAWDLDGSGHWTRHDRCPPALADDARAVVDLVEFAGIDRGVSDFNMLFNPYR
jgi:hypothetical protein